MKAAQLQLVRAQATQIVRELGLVIHHCEEAQSAARSRWRAQVAEDTAAARDAAFHTRRHAIRLDEMLMQLNRAAQEQKEGKS